MSPNNAPAPDMEREPPNYVDPTDPRSLQSDLDALAAVQFATDKLQPHQEKLTIQE